MVKFLGLCFPHSDFLELFSCNLTAQQPNPMEMKLKRMWCLQFFQIEQNFTFWNIQFPLQNRPIQKPTVRLALSGSKYLVARIWFHWSSCIAPVLIQLHGSSCWLGFVGLGPVVWVWLHNLLVQPDQNIWTGTTRCAQLEWHNQTSTARTPVLPDQCKHIRTT